MDDGLKTGLQYIIFWVSHIIYPSHQEMYVSTDYYPINSQLCSILQVFLYANRRRSRNELQARFGINKQTNSDKLLWMIKGLEAGFQGFRNTFSKVRKTADFFFKQQLTSVADSQLTSLVLIDDAIVSNETRSC